MKTGEGFGDVGGKHGASQKAGQVWRCGQAERDEGQGRRTKEDQLESSSEHSGDQDKRSPTLV